MKLISLNSLRPGDYIVIEEQPFIVLTTKHSHVGRGGAILKAKIKNLNSGAVVEKTFKGEDKLEKAEIEKKKVVFLYTDEKNAFFMDNQTYEQFSLDKNTLKEKIYFLKEGSELEIVFFNNNPISIELPPKIELKVISAPPGIRGDTAQGSVTKTVTLETGLQLNVPLFVKEGDIVKINTEKIEYVERV